MWTHLSLLEDHTPCREGPSWPAKHAGLPFQTLPWDRHVLGGGCCQLQHQPRQCWPSPPWDTCPAESVRARDSVPGALVQCTAPNTSWRACQPRRDALSSKERGTLDMRGSPQTRGPCGQAVFLGPFQESEGYQWSRNSVKGPQASRHQKT